MEELNNDEMIGVEGGACGTKKTKDGPFWILGSSNQEIVLKLNKDIVVMAFFEKAYDVTGRIISTDIQKNIGVTNIFYTRLTQLGWKREPILRLEYKGNNIRIIKYGTKVDHFSLKFTYKSGATLPYSLRFGNL